MLDKTQYRNSHTNTWLRPGREDRERKSKYLCLGEKDCKKSTQNRRVDKRVSAAKSSMKCPHSVALTRASVFMLEQTQVSYITITTDTETKEIKRRGQEESSTWLTGRHLQLIFQARFQRGKEKTETTRVIMHKRRGLTMASVDEKTSGKKIKMKWKHTETSFSSLHFTISPLNAVGEAAGTSANSAQGKPQKQIERARSRARQTSAYSSSSSGPAAPRERCRSQSRSLSRYQKMFPNGRYSRCKNFQNGQGCCPCEFWIPIRFSARFLNSWVRYIHIVITSVAKFF